MTETYCGKSCAECTLKEALSCPGCQQGLGRKYHGECAIAGCCREKGHASCQSCTLKENCRVVRNKEAVPEEVLRQRQARQAFEEHIRKIAPRFSILLLIYFWSTALSTGASVLQQIFESPIGLGLPLVLLNTITSVVIGGFAILNIIILLLMAAESRQFAKTAALFAAVIVTIVIALLNVGNPDLSLLLLIALAVLIYLMLWFECSGFMEITAGLSDSLSDLWRKFRKWRILLPLICAFASSLLNLSLISGIANLVVNIFYLLLIRDAYSIYRSCAVPPREKAKG